MNLQSWIWIILNIVFAFSLFRCSSDKTGQKPRLLNSFKLIFQQEVTLTVDSSHFWNTETVILQRDKRGSFFGYDFYAKSLYYFDSTGVFLKSFSPKRDSLGRSYHRLTDFIIDQSGNIVLYDNEAGVGVVIDTLHGDICNLFPSESTRWFYLAQFQSGNYLFCNSIQNSSLPILYAYSKSGNLFWSKGRSEPELYSRNNPLFTFGKCVALDTADNIFTVHPALYKVQCYNPSGEKLFIFSNQTDRWHQMPHQPIEQDSINWSGQISAIQLLATTRRFVLVFPINFIDGKPFEQWIDIYDFSGNYLSTIELPMDKRPLFVDMDNNIWFLRRNSLNQQNMENRTLHIEGWRLTENSIRN